MHGQNFWMPTTPYAGEHCVQIWSPNSKRGSSYGSPKIWVQKHYFSTQNQSCVAKIFLMPNTPHAGEHYVQIWSPNSKRGLSYDYPKFWVQKHCFSTQNQSCMTKIFGAPKRHYSSCRRTLCSNMKSQLQKGAGLSYGMTKFWLLKSSFLAQNQSCMAKNFRHPQKAILLMMKNIVSKFEVPTPKDGWVMAWQPFGWRISIIIIISI